MLVDKYLYDTYSAIISSLSEDLLMILDEQIDSLVEYGRRSGSVVKDAKKETVKMSRVIEYKGNILNMLEDKEIWSLEKENADKLGELDQFIADKYKILGRAGIKNPSVILYERFLRRIHSKEMSSLFDSNRTAWRGVYFVYQRLMSTARLAARYSRDDLFGDVSVYDSDGNLTMVSTGKSLLREEMVKRKILSNK